ncbi:AAA family ATPase [Nocardia lijiangensis]|uniref:nucleotide-binding protein n=1 Tax=Nocardia lijiangensis TaxID=299618 RepID=UPI003D713912
MSRNNDLPMLPPWLSDSDVTGGYEAPVENLPHDDLIDDASDRKRSRRKSQSPESRNDANQGSGRKDKKRRWLGRDKDEPAEEQLAEPPAGEPRRSEAPADSWGTPQSGDRWSSGPDAGDGRPGDATRQGQAERNDPWQQTDGPGRQQPMGGPEHPAPPQFDAHGQAPHQSTGGPGQARPDQTGGPGQTPPQQFGGPGQPIGGPGQARPEQVGGPGYPQQQPTGDGGPQWSSGPEQFGGPGRMPQQHGGPGQTPYQPTSGPGYQPPTGGPEYQPPTDGPGFQAQPSTGGPGQPPQPPLDGSSHVAQRPGEAWGGQPHLDDPRSSAPQRRDGQSSLPTRQPSQPSSAFQPLGQRTPEPTAPPSAPEPPPSNEATTRYQRLPDLPPPPSQVGPSPADEDSFVPATDDHVSDPRAEHSVADRTAENYDATASAAHRIPARDAGDPVSAPAAETQTPAQASTGHDSAQASPEHGSAQASTGHGSAQASTGHDSAQASPEHSSAQASAGHGSAPTAQDPSPSPTTAEVSPSADAERATTEFDGAPPWLAGPSAGTATAQPTSTSPSAGTATAQPTSTSPSAGTATASPTSTSPSAGTATASPTSTGPSAGTATASPTSTSTATGPSASAATAAPTSTGPTAAPTAEQGHPRTQERPTPPGDTPPSWLGGAEQHQAGDRPELPPPPTRSTEQPGAHATSPTAAPPRDTGRPGEPAPIARPDSHGMSASADPANRAEHPNSASPASGEGAGFDAAPSTSARSDDRIEGRTPGEDVESARAAGGRHRLPAEPDAGERQWGAPGPAQGGHRAPVSDQPAPGQVRRDPGVFAQQGGQAPGGEMPWTQGGYGAQPPHPQGGQGPDYGYADQRQGGYAPATGPDPSAYHIPGDRRPGEPGYPAQPGPGPVEHANNAPGFVAPPAADQQPPAPPQGPAAESWGQQPHGPAGESWGRQPQGPVGESWGQQPHGGPRQHQQGQPSLDDVPLRRAKKSPGSGWRKAVHHMSGGAINPGMSAEELRLQELVARIRQPVRGDYRIAVLSLKGGVGKTTTTMGLGSIFASIRGDRVIAVDANPDFGTLSQRVPLQTRSTVRDLLLDPSIERYSDVRRHTSQATSRLEVLASERDPAASEAFNDEEYRAVARILQRYYNIILTDCGTGLMHSAMAGVLDLAHSLVLISSAAIDGARSAAATLDWLSLHGHDHLVRNAVVVINLPREGSPNVGVQQLREYFLSRCRAVHIIPYDAHLSEGAEIDLHRLSKQAKRAYVELAATVADEFSVDHRRFHT